MMIPIDVHGLLPSYLLPFFTLSYPTEAPQNPDSFPNSTYYETGPRDLCFMITCIAVMAALRDILRLFVFEPFASWKLTRDLAHRKVQASEKTNGDAIIANGNGVPNGRASSGATVREARKIHHSVLRFAEQGWSVVYYPLQWGFGLYVHRNLPTRMLDPEDLWIGYPHFPLAGELKFYYLTQTAFYCHQILILNAEAPRKDHYQMLTHHFITIFLMGASYLYNFTRVGCLIMLLMDVCDIFLPLAKMIRYLEISQTLCDATFACFLVSWFVTRHVLFLLVIWSAMFDVPHVLNYRWDPAKGDYLTGGSHLMFVLCLLALQCLQILQILWFVVICRVAWRVLTGQGAADTRSDDESEDEKDK